MSNIVFFRILAVASVSLALAGAPQASFAQHGGFHGGGGFKGGGGFHGGGFSGLHSSGEFHGSSGFRGGNFGGFHGGRGFNGFRGGRFYGGFRGSRGYYPGFYSGFGFGFWPYWGGYPYWYGYSPWWAPGPYAYYSPDDYGDYPDGGYSGRGCDSRSRDREYDDDYGCSPHHRNRHDCYDYRQKCAPDNKPNGNHTPAKPSSNAAPESSPAGTLLTVSRITSASRPAVLNAIAALNAMPPAARERQVNSGRYDSFSPEERELLRKPSRMSVAETMN